MMSRAAIEFFELMLQEMDEEVELDDRESEVMTVEKAIQLLYEATDEEGKRLFRDYGQWYAVYRVLKEHFHFPEKMRDFVDTIAKKGWARKSPACKYSAVQKISSTCPHLEKPVAKWTLYKDLNKTYHKQFLVAEFLLRIFGINV